MAMRRLKKLEEIMGLVTTILGIDCGPSRAWQAKELERTRPEREAARKAGHILK